MDDADRLERHTVIAGPPGHGMFEVVPGIVDVDRAGRIIVAIAHNGMSGKVEHHRVAGIDLGFELGKVKASADKIIGVLVVTVGDGITPGLVE